MMPNHKISRLWLMLTSAVLSLFILSACNHNEKDEANTVGELSIELTDAEGDFSNYSVDVLAITLTKKDNTTVEVLPESTRIDFAQYVEMSELLSSTNVASGVYTAATLTIDYSNAEIFAEDANGDNIQVSSIVDENDQAITILQTSVTLGERNKLRIVPGVPAHLSLDFDLKTSNVVNFDDPTAPVLIVSPVLNASLEPALDKTHRVRGPLKSVNQENNSFDLIIRPFHHHLRETRSPNRREQFGSRVISINDETTFEINTESATGTDGLIAMSELDKFTAVIVIGNISLNPRRFNATEVYAGSSVPGGDMDVVKGTVLSRTDNTLIVKGATLIRAGGSILFNDEVTVTLDETTIVKRQHDENDYNIIDISVGQRVTVFGSLDEDSANPILDASSGMVRLLITAISGTVVSGTVVTEEDSTNMQRLSLNLKQINARRIQLFNFDGTGVDAANDADPTFYEVETSTLDLAPFTLDTGVDLRGFVNTFGAAPADFIATAISDKKRALKARMHTNWKPATSSAFSLISAEKITLDFTGAGRFHHVGSGKRKIDLVDQGTAFSLVPATENNDPKYVIQIAGGLRLHTTFKNLSDDLNDLIANGAEVRRIQASGSYDLMTGDFMAGQIKIKM